MTNEIEEKDKKIKELTIRLSAREQQDKTLLEEYNSGNKGR